ncbi:MAG: Ig-like domain-containing protein [Candidatus Manganitrophus sp.]|nr:Ig-like domain-containing protein [Candidatus Manganitrophus sp.]
MRRGRGWLRWNQPSTEQSSARRRKSGRTPNADPPSVVSTKPQEGETVSVDALIEITFNKSMGASTFQTAIEGLGNVGYEAICVADADCKTIRLSHETDLEYDFSYTLTLLADVRDQDGNFLASPYVWSFITAPSIVPRTFHTPEPPLTVSMGRIPENALPLPIDSTGTVHIVYYSEEDGSPKHAFCFSGEDCSAPENWDVQFIERSVSG